MVEIKLHDYWEETFWGPIYYGIGQGNLSASVIVPQIEAAKDEDIKVRINSGGGSVSDGWVIYNALISHPKKVTIQIDGFAASIASVIAMAGEDIIAMLGSILMLHKPTTQVWMYESMNSDDLKREAEALDKVQAVLNSLYAARTGLEESVIDEMINKETWLTPKEALALSFITEINSGTTVAHSIPQNAFNHIFNSAPERIKVYANQHYPIIKIENQMNKETEKLLKENKGTLTKIKNFFADLFKVENSESKMKDGTTFYYDGDLAEGTEVFSDAEMTTALADGSYELEDGRTITVAEGAVSEIADASTEDPEDLNNEERITELENQLEELRSENAELINAIKNSNDALSRLKNVKSTHQPKPKNQKLAKETEGNEPAKKFQLPSKEK